MEERVSDAEEAFERWRKRAGLVVGPLAASIILLTGADSSQRRLAAVMALIASLWICESLPLAVTALIAAVAVVAGGVAPAKEAFAAFGNPILFLFIGSFFLAEAMRLHGLGERFAHALARIARGRLGVLMALSISAFGISLWISNVAATAITLPIALSVARAAGDRKLGAALVLAIAYGASVGGVGTPIGTPPNLIGIAAMRERAGIDIGFFQWMKVGLPLGTVMLVALWGVLAWKFDIRRGQPALAAPPPRRPWTQPERVVAFAFGLAVLLWLLPGIVGLVDDSSAGWFQKHLPEEIVALGTAALLFLWPMPGKGRSVLTWSEATHIDWGTVILFGGGILLGDLAGKTGLSRSWGEALVAATGAQSLWGITALVTAVSILLSEATSNTATATLMVPLTISIAQAAHVDPRIPALGATLGASFGFMLPISTGPNAMAYGTGQVKVREMAGAGVIFDILGYGIILAGLRLLA